MVRFPLAAEARLVRRSFKSGTRGWLRSDTRLAATLREIRSLLTNEYREGYRWSDCMIKNLTSSLNDDDYYYYVNYRHKAWPPGRTCRVETLGCREVCYIL